MLLILVACSEPTVPEDSTEPRPVETAVDSEALEDSEAPPPAPRVLINELVAANDGTFTDEQGNPGDWLELYNAGELALDLSGCSLSDDYTDKRKHLFLDSLVLEPGAFLVLWADKNPEAGATHLPFSLRREGEGVGLFGKDGATLDWVQYPGLGEGQTWARYPDGGEDFQVFDVGTPGESNRKRIWEHLTLVEAQSSWRYDDSGQDLGTTWVDPAYDDSGWTTGGAPLGYGDSHQVTMVGYGGNSSAKNPTTYFRAVFPLSAVPATNSQLSLELMVDDGAAVYLNGAELLRHNLGAGDLSYATWASATVSGATETSFIGFEVDPAALVAGDNVIAVEVHQAGPTSSDMGFDLQLELYTLTDG